MPDYSIYGLSLRTRDPIPGVTATDNLGGEVLSVTWHPFRNVPPLAVDSWTQVDVPPSRQRRRISFYRPENGLAYRWMLVLHTDNFGDVSCVYDEEAATLDIHHPEDMSYEDCCSYFLGSVLGFVLRVLGHFGLHASAVAIDGKALLFVGPKRAGKSTTAAAIAYRQGADVISDDISILDLTSEGVEVRSAYGGVRLHADALSELADEEAATAMPVYSFVNKSYVFPEGGTDTSVPVKAIYFLAARDEEAEGAAVIRAIPAREAIPILTANTYASGAVMGREAIATEFQAVGRIANEIPVFVIENRSTLERLEELSKHIIDHASGLEGCL